MFIFFNFGRGQTLAHRFKEVEKKQKKKKTRLNMLGEDLQTNNRSVGLNKLLQGVMCTYRKMLLIEVIVGGADFKEGG